MIPLVALLVFVFFVWRGAGPVPLSLLAASFVCTFALSLRVLRASVGGVGAHAEWVRDVSVRPRLGRNPVWGMGVALLVGGIIAALAGC